MKILKAMNPCAILYDILSCREHFEMVYSDAFVTYARDPHFPTKFDNFIAVHEEPEYITYFRT